MRLDETLPLMRHTPGDESRRVTEIEIPVDGRSPRGRTSALDECTMNEG